jgi:DNA repair ATPase RecN
MWCSNGQAVIKAINDGLTKNKHKNILIGDEIDTGLSLANTHYYSQLIIMLSSQKQIILACHSTVFLELANIYPEIVDVYDFNDRSFISAKEYTKKSREEGFARMNKTLGLT